MIKAIRTHFNEDVNKNEKGLEKILNGIKINGDKILFVTSENYGGGEVAYTIIYEECFDC